MAIFLTEAALAGIKGLDKDSIEARDLRALDVDAVLKEDISKICATVTFSETARIFLLIAQLKSGRGDIESRKEDLKKIGRTLLERTEKEQGSLKIPPSCRSLLFRL